MKKYIPEEEEDNLFIIAYGEKTGTRTKKK